MQFKEKEIEQLLLSAFYYRDRFAHSEVVCEEMDSLIHKIRAYKDNYSVD